MFKKLQPVCLIVISAFVLFACSKDNAPMKAAPAIAMVKNASDSAISGLYCRYTFKGHTEIYTPTEDTVGLMRYYPGIYLLWTANRKGTPSTHESVAEFNFGKTWPTATGTYSGLFWIGADTSYRNDSMEYTITRNAANFGDTVEVSFKGLMTEEDAIGTPDTVRVAGDFRLVLVDAIQ